MRKRIRKLFNNYKFEMVRIIPYRSYGTNIRLYVKGRALDNNPLEINEKHSFVRTIQNAFRQFDTHEIADIKIKLKVGSFDLSTVTDNKGYFLFDALLPEDISKLSDREGWVKFQLFAHDDDFRDEFHGEFLIPELEADYGIISDIDDTILNTGVTSFLKWKVIRNSLFVNAYRRMPLPGAPDLYQKLHLGIENKEKNPIFYLSNSPWNMYDYLSLFLDHNNFPKGPILLRSFNSIFQRATESEKPHKQKEIFNLLETYPNLKFILIGDSGEHDASIYTEVAAQFPHRILCIYLRTVKHRKRMRCVKSIVDNFRTVPVLLVETSLDAEQHARSQGYI